MADKEPTKQLATWEREHGILVDDIEDKKTQFTEAEYQELLSTHPTTHVLSQRPASIALCHALYSATHWDHEHLEKYEDCPLYGEDFLLDKLRTVGRLTIDEVEVFTDDQQLAIDSGAEGVVPHRIDYVVHAGDHDSGEALPSVVDAAATLCISLAKSDTLK